MKNETVKKILNLPTSVFTIIFVFIITNLSRSAGFYDSPEYVISFLDNSIVHPSSYPFYFLFMKAFTLFVPGSVIFRMHVVNALFSFAALIFLYLFFRREGVDRKVSLLGVGIVFVSDYFLHYTFNFEVYSMFFLVSAAFFYVMSLVRKNGREYFPLFLFIFSMGLVIHPLMVFFLPFLIWHWWRCKPAMARLLLPVVLPFAAYMLLPALAFGKPLFNWEDPVTFKGLVNIITRRGFSHITMMLNPSGILVSGVNILKNSLIILILLPFWKPVKKDVFKILWSISYIAFISMMFFNVQSGWFDWAIYFFPCYILLFSISLKKLQSKKLGTGLLIALLILLGIINREFFPLGKYSYPEAYISDVISPLKEGKAIVFTDDDSTAYLLSLRFLSDRRITPVIISLWPYKWYREAISRYSGIDFNALGRDVSSAALHFMEKFPEYGVYITRGCEDNFSKLYARDIPPWFVTRLSLEGFSLQIPEKLALLDLPEKKSVPEVRYIYQAYDAFLKNGMLYFISVGDLLRAEEIFSLGNRNRWDLQFFFGAALKVSGYIDRSTDIYKIMVADHPARKEGYFVLLDNFIIAGNRNLAEELINSFRNRFPSDDEGYFRLVSLSRKIQN